MSWKPVTRAAPCPACGKADWCSRSEDDRAVHCERTDQAPTGWRLHKRCEGGGVIFVTDNGQALCLLATRNRARSRVAATVDPTAEAERCARALTAELAGELAGDLGVPADVLAEIGVGWSARRSSWTFPEVDPRRRVVGITYRGRDGSKRVGRGHRRGLCVPRSVADRQGVVLVVEGASDVAACLAMGLAVVGRPGAGLGAEHLAELLPEREPIVVGENDRKPDGRWPGRDGAARVAGALAREWDRPVSWSLPPEPAKDVRDYWIDCPDDDAAEAGRRLMEHLRAHAVTEQPPAPELESLTEESAKHLVTSAARAWRASTEGWRAACAGVLEFFERGGARVLPVNYLAAALDLSRGHLYRLADAARVLRQLSRTRDTGQLSQRQAEALVPMLDPPAWVARPKRPYLARPEAVPEVLEQARQEAEAVGRRMTGEHVRRAVRRLLPPLEASPPGRPREFDSEQVATVRAEAAELAQAAEVRRRIAEVRNAAAGCPDVPRLVTVMLRLAQRIAGMAEDDVPNDLRRAVHEADRLSRQGRLEGHAA